VIAETGTTTILAVSLILSMLAEGGATAVFTVLFVLSMLTYS
jgi:hypothetical protein